MRYALHEGATGEQLALLQQLPERRFDNIDEIAEQLMRVQPPREDDVADSPREESGNPPGGDAYTKPHPTSGAVRS